MIREIKIKNDRSAVLKPSIGAGCFLAETAQLIGDVRLGDRVSIWYQAVLRGDVAPILVGDETNIQDGSIVHASKDYSQTILGKRVTIGHAVILHGCRVGNGSLIGMGSILLDNCEIGENSLVGAGSLVTEGQKFASGKLILGRPAKVVRDLTQEELKRLQDSADNYLHYMSWYV
jgi:carbonic anhydrase/acetyltransferase-like protein (isoleucine patch superfamily)